MGDFASTLQSSIATAIGGDGGGSTTAVAEPPAASTPASSPTPEPSTPPASTPAVSTPPAAGTPAQPPAAPPETSDEEEFNFSDETPVGTAQTAADPNVQDGQQAAQDDPSKWDMKSIEELLPKQVIDKMLGTPKGQRIYESYKFLRELEKPVADGGLGFRPNLEQLRDMHQESSDWQATVHEFQNAHMDPQYADNWIRNWFHLDESGRPAPYATAVASSLADTLNDHSPDLYRAVALPFVQRYIGELYSQAEAETNAEARILKLNVANIIDTDINGQRARVIPQGMWEAPKPGDPTSQPHPQQAEVEAGLRRIQDFDNQQVANANNAFNARVNGELRNGLLRDVREALKPVADLYPAQDGKMNRQYVAIEKDFFSEVVRRVQENPEQLRQFGMLRDRAKATPDDPAALTAVSRAWLGVARPIMKALRAEYITDVRNRVIPESQQRHAVLDEASQKRGSTANGQPTAKDLGVGPMERQSGESFEDFIHRRTAAVSQNV